jgi:hypothetical protein
MMIALGKKTTSESGKCYIKCVLLSVILFFLSSMIEGNAQGSTHRGLQILGEETDTIRENFDPILFDIIVVGTESRFPTKSEYLYFEVALSRYLTYELSKQEAIINSVQVIQDKSSVKERPIQGTFEKSGGKSDSEDFNVRSLAIISQGIAELSLTVALEGSFTSVVRNQLDFASLVKHTINDGSTGIVQNLMYSSTANEEVKEYYKGVERMVCTGFGPENPSQDQGAFRVNSYDSLYATEEDNGSRYGEETVQQDTSVKTIERSPLPKTLDVQALHYRNVFGIILLSLCSMFLLMNVVRIGRKKNEKRKRRINLAKQAFEGPKMAPTVLGKGAALDPYGPHEKYKGTMDNGIIAEKGQYLLKSGIAS